MHFLPQLNWANVRLMPPGTGEEWRSTSPSPAASTLITSAPQSASRRPHHGPATERAEVDHADAGERKAAVIERAGY